MNTAIIMKTLTSRPARRVYKQIGKYTVRAAGTVAADVVAYFGTQKIIKAISKKTNYEPVQTCTINIRRVEEA